MLELSPKAKEIISYARKIAYDFGHQEVHTSHLLLSLITRGKGPVYTILEKFKLTSKRVNREIMSLYGHREGKRFPSSVDYPLSRSVQRIINRLGPKNAKKYGHEYVDCEDLLVALLSVEGGRATEVIINLIGNRPDIMKKAFFELLEEEDKKS